MSHLGREIVKILARKLTYFGWAGLLVVPVLVSLAVRFSANRSGPMGMEETGGGFNFDIASASGLYIPIGSVVALSIFLLPMLAAVSGSLTLAGEAEKGTLRTMLMQPVRRGAVLAAKWLAANLYVAVGLVILLASSLIAGGAFFGLKPIFLVNLDTLSTAGVGEGIGLILLAYLFTFVAMAAAVSLALLFSTLTDSGLTAMAGAMVLIIIMLVLGNISALGFLRPYFFTSHVLASFNFFRDPIAWEPIRDALVNFGVWIVGTTGIAWLIFRRKDVRS
jgi:ABC-2 type transport system permease protein